MKKDINTIWENALAEIQLIVSPAVFQTLFKSTKLKKLLPKEKTIVLSCPSSYIADLLSRRHQETIINVLRNQTKASWQKIRFETEKEKSSSSPAGPLFEKPSLVSSPQEKETNHYDPKTGLHPRFTFKTFVVGNANSFAYAAAQGIVKNPGAAYNPFFVWGGVGVGKTHLVQAIGHEILKLHPGKKVFYATAENFTNDLVEAIRSKNMTQFKQKYRQPDVLIIDDIQFIAGKESTQEEFFHTFNSLYIAEKQIILTSDRRPEEITPVEERLVSRFMGGLTVDIQPPDFEMRVAILKQKAEEKNVSLPEGVITFIAETVQSNARELDGVLSQIIARAKAKEEKITLELVKEFFGVRRRQEKKKISYRRILSVVAKTFRLKTKDICGKTRKKEVALARHIAAYLLRRELELPLQQVGQILGGRDHTTIMHAEEKIDRAFSTNQQLRHQIIQIQKLIYQ